MGNIGTTFMFWLVDRQSNAVAQEFHLKILVVQWFNKACWERNEHKDVQKILYFLLPLSHESLPRYTPNVSTTALKKAMAISQGVSSEEKRFGSLRQSGLNVASKKIQREERAKIHLANAFKNCLWYCVTVINLYQSVQQQKIAYYLNLLDCIFFMKETKD